ARGVPRAWRRHVHRRHPAGASVRRAGADGHRAAPDRRPRARRRKRVRAGGGRGDLGPLRHGGAGDRDRQLAAGLRPANDRHVAQPRGHARAGFPRGNRRPRHAASRIGARVLRRRIPRESDRAAGVAAVVRADGYGVAPPPVRAPGEPRPGAIPAVPRWLRGATGITVRRRVRAVAAQHARGTRPATSTGSTLVRWWHALARAELVPRGGRMHTHAESCTLPVDSDSLAIAEALAARLSLSPSAVVRLALSLLAEREDL